MVIGLLRLLFSWRGRIPRSTFWGVGLLLAFLFVVLLVFLETMFGRDSSLLLYPPFLWMMLSLWIKRMRDRGRSPLALLWILLPVLGQLWVVIELAFRRGTAGDNQYGPDPYDDRPDYLVVS